MTHSQPQTSSHTHGPQSPRPTCRHAGHRTSGEHTIAQPQPDTQPAPWSSSGGPLPGHTQRQTHVGGEQTITQPHTALHAPGPGPGTHSQAGTCMGREHHTETHSCTQPHTGARTWSSVQNPTPRPAASAAPSTVVSWKLGLSTLTCRMSACRAKECDIAAHVISFSLPFLRVPQHLDLEDVGLQAEWEVPAFTSFVSPLNSSEYDLILHWQS
jgi:hypothetical protein